MSHCHELSCCANLWISYNALSKNVKSNLMSKAILALNIWPTIVRKRDTFGYLSKPCLAFEHLANAESNLHHATSKNLQHILKIDPNRAALPSPKRYSFPALLALDPLNPFDEWTNPLRSPSRAGSSIESKGLHQVIGVPCGGSWCLVGTLLCVSGFYFEVYLLWGVFV